MNITEDQFEQFKSKLHEHLSPLLSSINLYKAYEIVHDLETINKRLEPKVRLRATIKPRYCINGVYTITRDGKPLSVFSNSFVIDGSSLKEITNTLDLDQYETIDITIKNHQDNILG